MFTLEYARDPVFGTETGDVIVLYVKWAEFNEEHHFAATTFDCMEHGRALHARALAGEFGEVAAYVPPPVNPSGEATQPQPSTNGAQQF